MEAGGPEEAARLVEYALLADFPHGAPLPDLSRATLLPLEETRAALDAMGNAECGMRNAEKKIVMELGNDFFIHGKQYRACVEEIAGFVRRKSQDGSGLSLAAAELRQGRDWPEPLWRAIDAELQARGLGAWKNARFVLREAGERMGNAEGDPIAKILAIYEETGYLSPRPDELPERLGEPQAKIDRLLEHLYNEGKLIRLAPHVILSRRHTQQAQDLVVRTIQETGGLNSGDFRSAIGSSRKYAIALLDFLDARRITIRIGNDRKLTRDYEKYLI